MSYATRESKCNRCWCWDCLEMVYNSLGVHPRLWLSSGRVERSWRKWLDGAPPDWIICPGPHTVAAGKSCVRVYMYVWYCICYCYSPVIYCLCHSALFSEPRSIPVSFYLFSLLSPTHMPLVYITSSTDSNIKFSALHYFNLLTKWQ